MKSELPPYFERLGDHLVEAARRRNTLRSPPGRRAPSGRRAFRVAAVAVALLLAVPLTGVLDEDRANALAIRRVGGRVEISITAATAAPGRLQDELRAAGIDAVVTAVPAAPSLVGHFVGYSQDANHDIDLIDGDGDGAPDLVVLPSGFDGSLEFYYGRSARPGEPYQAGGPPTRCADLVNRTVADVLGALVDHWPSIRWQRGAAEGMTVTEIPFDQVDPEDDHVVGLAVLSAEDVLVLVTSDPQRFRPASPC